MFKELLLFFLIVSTAKADCPDEWFACPYNGAQYNVKIGTCWAWGSFSCKPCSDPSPLCSVVLYPDWVSDHLALFEAKNMELPFEQILLPGTHNSGTSSISAQPDSFGSFVPWVRNQWADITLQLMMGVRYLDLTPCKLTSGSDAPFYNCHNPGNLGPLGRPFFHGPILANILEQVAEFMAQHPREVLIIFFQDYGADDNIPDDDVSVHAQLWTVIWSALSGLIVPVQDRWPSVNEMVRTNQRIVSLSSNQHTAESAVVAGTRYMYYSNVYAGVTVVVGQYGNNASVDGVFDYITGQASAAAALHDSSRQPPALMKMDWYVSPDAGTIVAGVLNAQNNAASLEQLGWPANSPSGQTRIFSWLTGPGRTAYARVNVFNADFITSGFIQKAISYNGDTYSILKAAHDVRAAAVTADPLPTPDLAPFPTPADPSPDPSPTLLPLCVIQPEQITTPVAPLQTPSADTPAPAPVSSVDLSGVTPEFSYGDSTTPALSVPAAIDSSSVTPRPAAGVLILFGGVTPSTVQAEGITPGPAETAVVESPSDVTPADTEPGLVTLPPVAMCRLAPLTSPEAGVTPAAGVTPNPEATPVTVVTPDVVTTPVTVVTPEPVLSNQTPAPVDSGGVTPGPAAELLDGISLPAQARVGLPGDFMPVTMPDV